MRPGYCDGVTCRQYGSLECLVPGKSVIKKSGKEAHKTIACSHGVQCLNGWGCVAEGVPIEGAARGPIASQGNEEVASEFS